MSLKYAMINEMKPPNHGARFFFFCVFGFLFLVHAFSLLRLFTITFMSLRYAMINEMKPPNHGAQFFFLLCFWLSCLRARLFLIETVYSYIHVPEICHDK